MRFQLQMARMPKPEEAAEYPNLIPELTPS